MSREAYNPPPISEWLVREFKLILFPSTQFSPSSREWWQEMTGAEPDESTRKLGVVTQTGVWRDSLRLSVSVAQGIMHWSADRVEPSGYDELPLLGHFLDELQAFVSAMSEWLPGAPPLARIGLGTSGLIPVESRRSAYDMLNTLLPFVDLDPDSSDFSYRINRRTRMRMDDSIVNDLATWACTQISRTLRLGSVPLPGSTTENYFAGAEVDINTNFEREKAFTAEETVWVLAELAALTEVRLKRGDTNAGSN